MKSLAVLLLLLPILAFPATDLFMSGRHLSFDSSSQNPESLVPADFDQDGFLDILATTALNYGASFTVFYGNQNGFGMPMPFSEEMLPCGAAVADFNADRFIDVAVGNCQKFSVWIFLNDQHRGWKKPMVLPLNNRPVALATGDFNTDGHPDLLLLASASSGSLVIFNGRGDGEFTRTVTIPVPTPGTMALADFTGDAVLDAAVSDYFHESVLIFSGTGGGSFFKSGTMTALAGAAHMAVLDLGNDGRKDLALSDSFGRIALLKGRGNGTFEPPRIIPDAKALSLASGDLNNDGLDDIAVVDKENALTYYMQRKDQKTFDRISLKGKYLLPPVSIADWNGDGRADVAAGSFQSAEVFLNSGKYPLPQAKVLDNDANGQIFVADFNADRKLDMLVYTKLIVATNGSNYSKHTVQLAKGTLLAVGDLNGDEKADAIFGVSSGKLLVQLMEDMNFGPAAEFPAGINPRTVHITDMNLDGIPDLVVRGYGPITTLFGNGRGGFSPPVRSFRRFGYFEGAEIVDFDSDGVPDMILVTWDHVATLKGKADGTFTLIKELFLEDHYFSDVVAGDFNRDGRVDFAAASPYCVFAGNGDGTFQPICSPYYSEFPEKIMAADFDRDGRLDLIARDEYGGGVVLLGSDSEYWFEEPFEITLWPWCCYDIAVIDWDHDGAPDIATTGDGLRLYRNRTPD